MALNLSRGKPIKFTSSNRIASLIGNGIYTFIDSGTQFNKIFNEDEVGSYKNYNDLGSKIEYLLSNEKKINQYGKNGKEKYFKLFNNKLITKKIISKTF
jgi:glycosyltransferase involved in cell wall biosynthesis